MYTDLNPPKSGNEGELPPLLQEEEGGRREEGGGGGRGDEWVGVTISWLVQNAALQ